MKTILQILILVVTGYTALYAAIWMHEVGHAVVYQGYGCNPDLWDVDVPWHFGNANPGPMDASCLDQLNTEEHFHGSMGGVVVNMIMAVLVFLFWSSNRILPGLLQHWLLFFGLSHLVEVATYFTISNLIPLSDMLGVQEYDPLLRIPLFLAGLCMIWLIIRWIHQAPKEMIPVVGWFCCCSALSMGGLRLFFTFINP